MWVFVCVHTELGNLLYAHFYYCTRTNFEGCYFVDVTNSAFCDYIFKDPLHVHHKFHRFQSCFLMISRDDGIMSNICKFNMWKLLHSASDIGLVSMPKGLKAW